MSIARRLNDLIAASALFAGGAFLVADEKFMLLILAFAGVGAAWLTSRAGPYPGRAWALPRPAISLLVLAAIAHAGLKIALVGNEPFVSLLGEFFVLLILIKLFDRRTPRDDAQVLGLSVSAAVAAVLTGASLLMGVMLIVYVPVVIAGSMLWQLDRGLRAAAPATAPARPESTAPHAYPGLRRAIAASVALCLLVCAIAAGVVFVFAPRGLSVGRSAGFGAIRGTVSGFTDQIQLGRPGMVSNNATPVLDAEFTDALGNNLGSADRTFYLRATTRAGYDPATGVWTPLPSDPAREEAAPHRSLRRYARFLPRTSPRDSFLPKYRATIAKQVQASSVFHVPEAGTQPRESPATIVQHVQIRPTYTGTRYIFAVWRPTSVSPSIDLQLNTNMYDGCVLASRPRVGVDRIDPAALGFEYTAVSQTSESGGEVPDFLPGFQEGPIHDLAVRILSGSGMDPAALRRRDAPVRQAANAFRDYVRTNCTYTLEIPPTTPGRDPIESFLLDTKTGHCQYFASAMVALCQSVGIRARLVAGYVATDFNDITGRYIVRESNAHAWVEAHLGAGRWSTFDPTPPADLERIHRPGQNLAGTFKRWWDALELSWSSTVVAFDQRSQARLLGQPERNQNSHTSSSDDAATWLRGRAPSHGWWVTILVAGIPAALVIGALIFAARSLARRLGLRRLAGDAGASDPELRLLLQGAGFYPAALAALARSGVAKPDTRPPRAHADLLIHGHPAPALAFRRIANLYYRLRFGRRPLTQGEEMEADDLVALLRNPAQDGRPDGR